MNKDTNQEISKLKKELVLLRMYKITKQKNENHKIKKIQKEISKIYQLNSKNKSLSNE
uniref:Ribosomal protein L29 n=1 Tax=Kapraunia schneideri TaxID=717899 RepID=A0A1Z1MS93_9FLOR|nr:ribosomal protein L29 [Kapraunia schneideri]ARW68960.1 ribosomal protein L29 [Kapraunia schneideri]